jgi:MFS transporter, AAHS family, 4-hydroxybenzoate transporter
MSDAMAQKPAVLSPAAASAGQKTGFRWIPILLCAATMFTEGYDAQFLGSVVPGPTGLAAEYGVAPGAMWPALSAGLAGLMFGAFLIAPLADSIGRRRVILFSVAIFSILTVASIWAESLFAMTIFRFLTGLGLGGAMANTTAMTADFSPPEKRATAVALMFCMFSLGAAFGGFIASGLLPDYGWRAVFLFCGVMGVGLLPLLFLALPESIPVKEGAKLTIPAGQLFAHGRTRVTLLFWAIFFANLMELYLITSWLPLTISAQLAPLCAGAEGDVCRQQLLSHANFATGLLQMGGIAGAIMLAPLVDRYGSRWVLAGAFLSAAALMALLGSAGTAVPVIYAMAFAVGIGTVGAQNCNNGNVAKFYPTEIRATGVGWALAVGRNGSILGPAVGGMILASGLPIQSIFLVATLPPLVAAAAYLAMGNPPELRGKGL